MLQNYNIIMKTYIILYLRIYKDNLISADTDKLKIIIPILFPVVLM